LRCAWNLGKAKIHLDPSHSREWSSGNMAEDSSTSNEDFSASVERIAVVLAAKRWYFLFKEALSYQKIT